MVRRSRTSAAEAGDDEQEEDDAAGGDDRDVDVSPSGAWMTSTAGAMSEAAASRTSRAGESWRLGRLDRLRDARIEG